MLGFPKAEKNFDMNPILLDLQMLLPFCGHFPYFSIFKVTNNKLKLPPEKAVCGTGSMSIEIEMSPKPQTDR